MSAPVARRGGALVRALCLFRFATRLGVGVILCPSPWLALRPCGPWTLGPWPLGPWPAQVYINELEEKLLALEAERETIEEARQLWWRRKAAAVAAAVVLRDFPSANPPQRARA